VPQHRLKFLGVSEDFHQAGFRPFDAADDDFVSNPGDNHVAVLQNLIYAHFAAATSDPAASLLPEVAGTLEQTVMFVSRTAGIIALIAALAALVIVIF
jgi:hypothetical protein